MQSFRYLYDEKSPYNTIDFMKRLIDYFPFRIHSIQTDNGTEFTYRKHLFDTEHPYYKRIHSALNYNTPFVYFYKLRNS